MLKDKKNYIIAIDGPDRVGKETQTKLLNENLKNSVRVQIPWNDSYTYDKIYELLKNGDAKKYPVTFQSLQVLNRILFQNYELPKLKEKYDIIIFDRWDASTYAYGRAIGIERNEISILSNFVIQPDITIILSGKSYSKDEEPDSYEKDKTLQERVCRFYDEWVTLYKDTHDVNIISSNGTKEEIQSNILNIVTNKIGKIND